MLTPSEVAKQLHISRATLYRLRIPYAMIGRQRRYHPDAVQAWVASHTVDNVMPLHVYRPMRATI